MSIKVDVGTPPDGLSDDWTTTVICFHGFADLSTTRDECVESPEFSCFGHQWTWEFILAATLHQLKGALPYVLGTDQIRVLKSKLVTALEMQMAKKWDIINYKRLSLVLPVRRVVVGAQETLPRDQQL